MDGHTISVLNNPIHLQNRLSFLLSCVDTAILTEQGMTKILPFLRPSLYRKFRPSSPAASGAHLRLYSTLRSGQSDTGTSDFQWRQQTPVSEHVSRQDRLYPRIASQPQAISGSHFRSRYSSLQHDEVEENEEVILRGISRGPVNDKQAHASRKGLEPTIGRPEASIP